MQGHMNVKVSILSSVQVRSGTAPYDNQWVSGCPSNRAKCPRYKVDRSIWNRG